MSRIIQLLQTLQSIFGFIPIDTILEVISHLKKIGRPPSLTDKDALHNWLQGLLPVLDTVSEATPMEIDDNMIVLIRTALEDEEAWNALYGLISLMTAEWNLQSVRNCKSTKILSDKTELDMDTIMEIVKMIMDLVELLKK